MSEHKSLAQEIIVIAMAVLCLVVFLGFVIVSHADFKRPRRRRDTDDQRDTAARGSPARRADGMQHVGPSHNESFVDLVRRQGAALAEQFKRRLTGSKRKFSPPLLLPEPRPADPAVAALLQSFTIKDRRTAGAGSREGIHGSGSDWHDDMDSPTLNTERYEGLMDEDSQGGRAA